MSSTQNILDIYASPEAIYEAFVDPELRVKWQAPGTMTAEVHQFFPRVGGGYQMSLFYPTSDGGSPGKTNSYEDRFTSRFIELEPPHKIVEGIHFDSKDPAFAGEMIMELVLIPIESATRVILSFRNIPPGISPADNQKGTQLSLQKLAWLVEQP